MALATAICGGISLVFLAGGTGAPLMRFLVLVIFFVSAINLGVYLQENLAENRKKKAPPPQGKDGRPGGGGGERGGGQSGGGNDGPGGRSGGRPENKPA